MSDDSSYDKLNKTIKNFNDYLAKIKKEVDLNEHSLAIHYDYDIVPLPDDIIDEANRKENKMKVKELIKVLKDVPNQNARVDLMIPYQKYNDTSNDYCTDNFYVDTVHAQHQDDTEYVEIYGLVDMETYFSPNPNEQRVVSHIKVRENHKQK